MPASAAFDALMPPIIPSATVPVDAPLRWLRAGWRDFQAHPFPGLAHGAALTVFGAVLLAWAREQFWWLAGAFSGFLIVAPVLVTGLYAVSRAESRGEAVSWRTVWSVWASLDRRLVAFGLLLSLAGTGWVLTSAALITAGSPVPIRQPVDFLRHVVMDPNWGLFEWWVLLGGALAAPVFASSVVAMPMLLDRPVSVWTAVRASWLAVANNPVPMAIWASLLMGLVLLGMLTGLVGLVVVVPLLAHASWHAYADLVRAA